MFVLFMIGVMVLSPGELVMKSGKLLAYKGEYIIEGPWIKFTGTADEALCLPLKMVDLEKTLERDKKIASERLAKQSHTVQEGSFAELVKKSSPKSAGPDGGTVPSFTGLKKPEPEPDLDVEALIRSPNHTPRKITVASLIKGGTLADWARASEKIRAEAAVTMTLSVASNRKRNYSGRQGELLLSVDAYALMVCINEVAVAESLSYMRVAEIAAGCVLLLE